MEKLFYRGKGTDLPTSASSSSSGNVFTGKSNGVTGMNVVNKSVALSLLWVVFSMGMLWFGYGNCRANSYNYQIKCAKEVCTLIKSDPMKDEKLNIEFPVADLLRVDAVRINDNGDIVDSAKMRLEPKAKFGHSLKLTIKLPADKNSKLKITKDVIFTTRDMSRRPARSGSSKISALINGTKKSVNFSASSSVTLLGVMMIIIGIISVVCAFIFGEWKDKVAPNKRPTRKSS
jgi:preprotein translocase subunit SecG